MTDYINYEEKYKTLNERHKHLTFMIGETLVRNSKWELSNEDCIDKIRMLLIKDDMERYKKNENG